MCILRDFQTGVQASPVCLTIYMKGLNGWHTDRTLRVIVPTIRFPNWVVCFDCTCQSGCCKGNGTAQHEPVPSTVRDSCEHCIPPPCLLCCDLCNPNWTEGMKALNFPPKTSRRPNHVKVTTDYTCNKSDNTLKAALFKWRWEVHTEFWGSKINHFLGPAALVSNENIEYICHLSHTHAICTVDDIANNIWGAQHPLIMKHAKSILNLIHLTIPPPQTTSISEGSLPPNTLIQPVVAAAPKWAPYKCKLCKTEGHTH